MGAPPKVEIDCVTKPWKEAKFTDGMLFGRVAAAAPSARRIKKEGGREGSRNEEKPLVGLAGEGIIREKGRGKERREDRGGSDLKRKRRRRRIKSLLSSREKIACVRSSDRELGIGMTVQLCRPMREP